MVQIEACPIELTTAGNVPTWGGEATVYDVRTDEAGAVVTFARREVADRHHRPPLVRLDQFESCARQWRFGESGSYEIGLIGGTTAEGVWVVEVRQGSRKFRLIIPRRS